MGIEAITLALDGVILDTEEAQLRACNAAFGTCGLDLQWSLPQLRAATRVWGAANVTDSVAERMGLAATDERVVNLGQEKNRLFHDLVLGSQPVRSSGGAQLMADALESGCKIAVVTDMPAQTATTLLDLVFGNAVTNIFSVIVSGADFSTAGGNGPYDLALRTMGAEPGVCVAVDAAVPGLNAARQAGIWTMAVTPYEKDIARISGADIWCPQMQELRDMIERRNVPRTRPERFVTFDALRAFKRERTGMPVLSKPVPVRVAA
ncbi:HAD family hydrolase [Noviherbaspirillum sp. ST9]|uniref:HAD family hydrolase n=1 Tax=Noviherbaspirillum sp. ST9 TaxID=3401606 RepID=UPI003B588386